MVIPELADDECRSVLRRNHLARIACARRDQPYVVPIQFDFDGEHLYFFATLGQKIIWMRDNHRVCVEVEDVDDKFHWCTVLVFGQYEELRGAEHEEAKRHAQQLFSRRDEWWQPGAARFPGPEHHVPVVFRVRPDRITGRRAARNS